MPIYENCVHARFICVCVVFAVLLLCIVEFYRSCPHVTSSSKAKQTLEFDKILQSALRTFSPPFQLTMIKQSRRSWKIFSSIRSILNQNKILAPIDNNRQTSI